LFRRQGFAGAKPGEANPHGNHRGPQRISGAVARYGRIGRASDLQAAVDVPGGQSPFLSATKLTQFGKRLVMFVRLNPQAGEAGAHIFGQTLGEPPRRCPMCGHLI
jgi:hypothetical protein